MKDTSQLFLKLSLVVWNILFVEALEASLKELDKAVFVEALEASLKELDKTV